MKNFQSQAARDAAKLYSDSYAEYIEGSALEYAQKFPDQANHFLTQSLGEALQGNDGN